MTKELLYKHVDDSKIESARIVRQNHMNGAGRLFGGTLMEWIDEVAGIVARRHAMTNVTTAAVDNLMFLKGAYVSELIIMKGKVTWVGNSSIEVCVDTFVEHTTGDREQINNAHFIMVALDEDGKPIKVPRLIVETEEEKRAWAHGEERKKIRDKRRKDNLDGDFY